MSRRRESSAPEADGRRSLRGRGHAAPEHAWGRRFPRLRLLRNTRSSDWLLSGIGGAGPVEEDIAAEMAAASPLLSPASFEEAHAAAMHALEVLGRNGPRPPKQVRAGPITPVLQFLVQRVIRYIVRGHQRRVAKSIRNLYTQRLGWIYSGDPSRRAVARGRRDVERAAETYPRRRSGVPTFLLGGAVASSLSRLAQVVADTIGGSTWGLAAAWAAAVGLAAGSSWVVLRGASIARRRIRVTVETPLSELWAVFGAAGKPPHDGARNLALLALGLTALGGVLASAAVVWLPLH